MKPRISSENGFTLVEMLVAVAILAVMGVGILAAMTLSSKVLISTDNSETAQNLAVAEMEYIKSLNYNTNHYDFDANLIPSGSGYTVTVTNPPEPLQDGNLQKITVTISRNGTTVTTLEGYKIKWLDN